MNDYLFAQWLAKPGHQSRPSVEKQYMDYARQVLYPIRYQSKTDREAELIDFFRALEEVRFRTVYDIERLMQQVILRFAGDPEVTGLGWTPRALSILNKIRSSYGNQRVFVFREEKGESVPIATVKRLGWRGDISVEDMHGSVMASIQRSANHGLVLDVSSHITENKDGYAVSIGVRQLIEPAKADVINRVPADIVLVQFNRNWKQWKLAGTGKEALWQVA